MSKLRSTQVLIVGLILSVAYPHGAGGGFRTERLHRTPWFSVESLVASYESLFGEKLDREQHDGFLRLVRFIATDEAVTDLRRAAYMLATVRHETAFTWQPVREFGLGDSRPYGVPDSEHGEAYYGRGYVQLTWKENYERAGRALGRDFVGNPDKTLDPETAYQILSRGMHEGWFTGKALDDYISGTKTDYVNARRIVNGTDKAEEIASEARKFETLLRRERALRETFAMNSRLGH